MTSHFEYKGHFGSAQVDSENGVLFGRLLYIRDVIGYDASTVQELRIAFEVAVDDYLDACSEKGIEPDTPCKGSFNIRIGPERHRSVALLARNKGLGLNEYVCWALDEVEAATRTVVHRHEVTVTDAREWVATTANGATWEVTSGTAKH
jgi:predicted HicB family RNase H-like nuclease